MSLEELLITLIGILFAGGLALAVFMPLTKDKKKDKKSGQ